MKRRAVVIGGGIAGTSVAARLAPYMQVELVETEKALGYHASGRSAALFEENYGAPAVQALNRASACFLENGGYLSARGFLLLAKAGDMAAFEADLETLDCTEIGMDPAREMLPILADDVVRAGYHAGARDIDTDRLVQDFARDIRSAGGEVHLGARVERIEHKDGKWLVTTPQMQIAAEILINAAGAWADQIARLAGIEPLGHVPCRRSMARVPAPLGHDVSQWPMFFGPGETWYAKPDAGKLLISPADEDPVEPHDAWAEDLTLAEGIDRYHGYVGPEVTRVETSWAGLRTFAPDRNLVLGPDPVEPSFVWCAGQGGYGFSTAPAASQLVADLILERPTKLGDYVVAQLTPDRLRRT